MSLEDYREMEDDARTKLKRGDLVIIDEIDHLGIVIDVIEWAGVPDIAKVLSSGTKGLENPETWYTDDLRPMEGEYEKEG